MLVLFVFVLVFYILLILFSYIVVGIVLFGVWEWFVFMGLCDKVKCFGFVVVIVVFFVLLNWYWLIDLFW